MLESFSEQAEIRVVPSANSSASAIVWSGADEIRECVRWALKSRFIPEQTRYYRLEGNAISWWMLATTPYLQSPVKGRVEITNGDDGIDHISFYPLDMQTVEALEKKEAKASHRRPGLESER